MIELTGGYAYCSEGCRGLEIDKGYKLIDSSRCKLICGHFSSHI